MLSETDLNIVKCLDIKLFIVKLTLIYKLFSVKWIWFLSYKITTFCCYVIIHICQCPQSLGINNYLCNQCLSPLLWWREMACSFCGVAIYNRKYSVFCIHQSVMHIILPIIYCNLTELEWDFTPSQLGLVIILCFTLSRRWHELIISNNKLLFPMFLFDATSWFKFLKQSLIVYNCSMHYYKDVIILFSLYLFPVYDVCCCVQPLWCCND
jgi:hypothetical protein